MTAFYRLPDSPCLISFSGGRTSAFMLRQILDEYGGELPPDKFVTFANTGKEREETLRFVHECESRWGVKVHWLELKARPKGLEGRRTPPAERFEEVGYNSASRNGEPLRVAIKRKRMLPNPATRFCTIEAKIRVMRDFMKARGYKHWFNVVGLRADEVRRISKGQKRNDENKDPWTTIWPMLKAGVTARDVWRFWLGDNVDPKKIIAPLPQGFDLGLWPYEGNCDGCFLKGRGILTHQERERPGYLDWWAEVEREMLAVVDKSDLARWRKEWSIEELQREVAECPMLPTLDPMELEMDAECGVSGTDHRIRCGREREG